MFSTSSSSTTPSGTNMLDFSCFCFFSFSSSSIAQAPPSSVPFPKARFPASSVSLFHSNTSASSEASLLKFVSSNRLNFLNRSSLSFVFATASRSIALILWFRSFFALLDCVRSRYSFGSCPRYSFAVKYSTSGKSDVRKRLCCFSSRTVLNDFDFKDDDVFSVKAAYSLSSPSRGFLSPSSSSSSSFSSSSNVFSSYFAVFLAGATCCKTFTHAFNSSAEKPRISFSFSSNFCIVRCCSSSSSSFRSSYSLSSFWCFCSSSRWFCFFSFFFFISLSRVCCYATETETNNVRRAFFFSEKAFSLLL